MAKKKEYATTVAIDTRTSTVHYYSMCVNDRSSLIHKVKSYSGGGFGDGFFSSFKNIIGEFAAEIPSASIRKISLVLPDNAVALDTVSVPTMRTKSATENARNIAFQEIYSNFADLKVSYFQINQGKQNTVYTTSAIQKRILASLYSACSENKMLVDTTTFASGSTVAAVSLLNPDIKNATYLLLDIKDTYSRFVFVVNGMAVGYYSIPFGLECLESEKVIGEDMLFDHSLAALTVFEAKEKAKAKKMSVITSSFGDLDDEDEAENEAVPEDGDEETDFLSEYEFTNINGKAKKLPRVLPEFMQRPIPEKSEDIVNENFRVFVKWALSLLNSNERIIALGAPEFVCVNIPRRLSFAVDFVNAQREENGIEFRALVINEATPDVIDNLELYGGLFPKAINKCAKF